MRLRGLSTAVPTTRLVQTEVEQVFGSQRSLMSIEDFTEFEQRAAYFDGDPVLATKKGVNPLERGTQVHHMAELQKLLDFPARAAGRAAKAGTQRLAGDGAEVVHDVDEDREPVECVQHAAQLILAQHSLNYYHTKPRRLRCQIRRTKPPCD